MYALAVRPEDDDELDQHVFLRGTWKDFTRLLAIRGDEPTPRMFYLDGEIELMSPSGPHEVNKKKLAGLLEMWLLERGHEFSGVGSWTLKKERKKAGGEPDECYILGVRKKALPDLVIEVDWSRSSASKRAVYERLGVRELWTLRPDGTCAIHVLTRGKYVERSESKILPDLNMKWLLRFLAIEPQSRAVRALRDALRRRPRRRR